MFLTPLKTILLISTLLLISGCASFGSKEPTPVEIRTVEVPTPITHPTLPRPIDLKDPQWFVVSDSNIDTFLEDIKKRNNGQVVFVAMTVKDYELMAYNMQEIRRYINQTKEVILYYRTLDGEKEK